MFFYKDGSLYRKSDGKKAAYYDRSCKYMRMGFDGKHFLEHRVIWAMHKGYWPKTLDHINRDRIDNRIENLRVAGRRQNAANSTLRNDNSTGYRGVINHKMCNGYVAQGSSKSGKRVHLGVFTCLKEAALAYNHHAEKVYGPFAVFNQVFEDVDNHSEE